MQRPLYRQIITGLVYTTAFISFLSGPLISWLPIPTAQAVEAVQNQNQSQLRAGLEEALHQIRTHFPDMMITSLDAHRHQITDKYVYRITGDNATYEYQWVFYDGQTYITTRPVPPYIQTPLLELLHRQDRAMTDYLNIDIINNLVKNAYRNGKISDWHLSDLRYEIPQDAATAIPNPSQAQESDIPLPLTQPLFWLVDVQTPHGRTRVMVDAVTGDFIDYDSRHLFNIDVLANRKYYYRQFYPEVSEEPSDTPFQTIFQTIPDQNLQRLLR